MFKHILFFVSISLSTVCSFAVDNKKAEVDEDQVDLYVFSSPRKKFDKRIVEKPLYSFIEESPDFINFQESVPTLRQSIIYKGLSPRQLEINYNGFKLIDPSSPEGVYDLFGLMQFKGLTVSEKNGEASLNLLTSLKENKKELSLSSSTLGQSNLSGSMGLCGDKVCYSVDAFFNRQGGVSQFDDSKNDPLTNSVDDYEKDFLKTYGVSLSRLSTKKGRSATHFFATFSDEDDDDLFTSVDDKNASSNSITYFLGHELKIGNNHLLRTSYFNNSRDQKNEADSENPNSYESSQDGRSLNVGFFYKSLSLDFDYENYKVESETEDDFLISGEINKEFKNFGFKRSIFTDVEAGFSRERGLFADMRASYNDLTLSFKKSRPSLYQVLDPIVGNEKLKPETLLGLSYIINILSSKNSSSIDLEVSYFRMWDLINFYDPDGFGVGAPGSFDNVDEAENLFATLKASHKVKNHNLDFFVRYLISKDLNSGEDIVRRPRWTSGFRLKSFFKNNYETGLGFKYIGRRLDFDFSELEPILLSDAILSKKFGWGRANLSLFNLINERRQVFSKIGRRGFEIKLGVDLIF